MQAALAEDARIAELKKDKPFFNPVKTKEDLLRVLDEQLNIAWALETPKPKPGARALNESTSEQWPGVLSFGEPLGGIDAGQ